MSDRPNREPSGDAAFHRHLFKTHPQPMLVHDPEASRILAMNDAAAGRLGYTNDRIAGLTVDQIVDPVGDDANTRRIHRRDGTAFDGDVREHPIEWDGCAARVLVIDDAVVRDPACSPSPHEPVEQALATAQQQSQLIIDAVGDGLHGIDKAGHIMFDNPAARRMLGWDEDEIIGQHSHTTIHHHHTDGSKYPVTECPIYRTLRDGETRHVSNEVFFRKDGSSFPVEYTCSAIFDPRTNDITGAIVSFQDMSQRIRTEILLRAESEIFEMISGHGDLADVLQRITDTVTTLYPESMAAVLLVDGDGQQMRLGAGSRVPDDLARRMDGDLIAADSPLYAASAWSRELMVACDTEQDAMSMAERAVLRQYGMRACWSIPALDTGGKALGTFTVYIPDAVLPNDRQTRMLHRIASLIAMAVTRIREREELCAVQERFRLLEENVAEVFWIAEPKTGKVTYISPAFDDIWLSPRAQIYDDMSPWFDSLHEDDRERVIAGVETQKREPITEEYRIRRPDGSMRWISGHSFPVFDDAGDVCNVVGTMRDITTRKIAELALAERVKELQSLYRALQLTTTDSRPAHEICTDIADILTGGFVHLDRTVARIMVDGQDCKSQGWREPVGAIRSEITLRDGTWQGYVEVGYVDLTPAEIDGAFLREEKDLIEAIATHIGNMLSDRMLTETLRQSERLGAIGELTGGIAHDFNNLLTVILGNAEMMVEGLPEDAKFRKLAILTRSAAERGAELTNRLLAFARKQALDPSVTNVNALLLDMQDLLERSLGEHIEIRVDPDDGLWPSLMDRSQLENAILNLCINARDAMTRGGRLTIETANIHLDDDYAAHNPEVIPGDYVMIAISDTGTGMGPDVISRAFDPFFTTKDVGKGSGLGLSMVYGFIKQSKGHVKIYSELEQGTTIKLYLPRTLEDGESRDPVNADTMPGGTEKILLVEDDDMVRQHVAGQLRDLGYHILSVDNGRKALEILEQETDIDLLFTDVVMPGGLNGRELADRAKALRPGLPVLFTSGYTENAIVHHGRLDPGVDLLHKPYRRKDLAHKVRMVLDRERPGETET